MRYEDWRRSRQINSIANGFIIGSWGRQSRANEASSFMSQAVPMVQPLANSIRQIWNRGLRWTSDATGFPLTAGTSVAGTVGAAGTAAGGAASFGGVESAAAHQSQLQLSHDHLELQEQQLRAAAAELRRLRLLRFGGSASNRPHTRQLM